MMSSTGARLSMTLGLGLLIAVCAAASVDKQSTKTVAAFAGPSGSFFTARRATAALCGGRRGQCLGQPLPMGIQVEAERGTRSSISGRASSLQLKSVLADPNFDQVGLFEEIAEGDDMEVAVKDDDEIDPRTVFMPADESASHISFYQSIGLIPTLCTALSEMGISVPTEIQEESLPTAVNGESVLLCAETGSGKTLAFLLPLVQRLKRDEDTLGIQTRPQRPRALVLVPTRELGQQILLVAKGLSRHAKFSSCGLFGGSSMARQVDRLKQGVDLVVGTPGRIVQLMTEGELRVGDVRFVVADEADTMAAQGFGEDLAKILGSVASAGAAARTSYTSAEEMKSKLEAMLVSSGEAADSPATKELQQQIKLMRGPFATRDKGHVQCILAAATVPEPVKQIIADTFPRFREVRTTRAHMVPTRITQEFLRVTGSDRAQTLLDVIDRGQRMNQAAWSAPRALDNAVRDATIVFCNTKDSAVFASKLLRERGYEVSEGHGWLAQTDRAVQLEAFMSGKSKILVSTDIMARGIDTINVAHVVNFDFPRTSVDYLHRVGRTARSGGSGRVTNFVAKSDYTLATAIERASKLGKPIETLSSRRSDYVQGQPGLLKSDDPRGDTKVPYQRQPKRNSRGGGPKAGSSRPKPKDTTSKKMSVLQPRKKK